MPSSPIMDSANPTAETSPSSRHKRKQSDLEATQEGATPAAVDAASAGERDKAAEAVAGKHKKDKTKHKKSKKIAHASKASAGTAAAAVEAQQVTTSAQAAGDIHTSAAAHSIKQGKAAAAAAGGIARSNATAGAAAVQQIDGNTPAAVTTCSTVGQDRGVCITATSEQEQQETKRARKDLTLQQRQQAIAFMQRLKLARQVQPPSIMETQMASQDTASPATAAALGELQNQLPEKTTVSAETGKPASNPAAAHPGNQQEEAAGTGVISAAAGPGTKCDSEAAPQRAISEAVEAVGTAAAAHTGAHTDNKQDEEAGTGAGGISEAAGAEAEGNSNSAPHMDAVDVVPAAVGQTGSGPPVVTEGVATTAVAVTPAAPLPNLGGQLQQKRLSPKSAPLPANLVLQRFRVQQKKECNRSRRQANRSGSRLQISSSVHTVAAAAADRMQPAVPEDAQLQQEQLLVDSASHQFSGLVRKQQGADVNLLQSPAVLQPQLLQRQPSAGMAIASLQQLQQPISTLQESMHSTPDAGAVTHMHTEEHPHKPVAWIQLQQHPLWQPAVTAAVNAFCTILEKQRMVDDLQPTLLPSGSTCYAAQYLWEGLVSAIGTFLHHTRAPIKAFTGTAGVQNLLQTMQANYQALLRCPLPGNMTEQQWDEYQPTGFHGDWQWAALILQRVGHLLSRCHEEEQGIGAKQLEPFVTVLMSLHLHV